jgi:hypothetical protein
MRKLVLSIALALGAHAAHAANGSFYLGAGFSYNDISSDQNYLDIKGSSWKAYAGFRPINLFAIEADYLDLGSGDSNHTVSPLTCVGAGLPTCGLHSHSWGNAYAGYVVGFLPIPWPLTDLYAKAGAAHWKLNSDISGAYSYSSSKSGTDFAWGIGVQVHITRFGARLEYERLNVPNSNGANIASLSAFLSL